MAALAALALLWGWLLILAGPPPVRAQSMGTAPGSPPASLLRVELIAQSPGESHFRLSFSPRANGFGTVGGNASTPSIGFALSSRGNSAVAPPGLSGLVRGMSFEQMDTVLIVHFATAEPAQAVATAIDPATVDVTVSNGVTDAKPRTHPAMTASPSSGTAPPQSPADIAAPPADSYELVMLRYADVSEVVGLLTDGQTVRSNDVFTPREPGFGQTSLTGGNYSPVPMAPPAADDQPLGQSVDANIAVDRRLNAVWLKGSPEHIARMKQEIAMIDVPVDSVILETQLVELTENGARNIGIDFSNANGQIAVATVQSGQFIPIGMVANSGGRMSSLSLQAAINAQVQSGEGRIVSRPRISAQSGATAKIVTGDALPILTAITLSGVNGVSQQVQYVNVGVTLQIAPRVTPEGYVSAHIFCVVSSVSGYAQGYPTISQREAQTSATVRDGDTFVIGGLTQESSLSNNSKVPLLGDVPLVGQAFRDSKVSKSRTELYIVVTPHIVRLRAPGDAETGAEAAASAANGSPPQSMPPPAPIATPSVSPSAATVSTAPGAPPALTTVAAAVQSPPGNARPRATATATPGP